MNGVSHFGRQDVSDSAVGEGNSMLANEMIHAARRDQSGLPPQNLLQMMTCSETMGTETAIQSAALRAAVLAELQETLVPGDRALLRFVLEQEICFRTQDGAGEFFENLYWAGFLLSLVAQVEDVRLLWRAKTLDFDTMSGFDVQFLVGAGVSLTLSYLQSFQEEWALAARAYLEKCQQAGDFVDLEQHRHWRHAYFRSGETGTPE
jgi:hypothetical protein